MIINLFSGGNGGSGSGGDTTDATVTETDVMNGKTITGADGVITGSAPFEYMGTENGVDNYKVINDQTVIMLPDGSKKVLELSDSYWQQSTFEIGSYFDSICYGDSKFVAVSGYSSTRNVGAYSEDGINWVQTSMPTAACWNSVCYANGKFVTVANNSSIAAYSEDGINWVQTVLPANTYWTSVCYGNGKFVAVSGHRRSSNSYASNITAYSEDGITWTQGELPASNKWCSVCYGGGKFVTTAAGSLNTIVAYSEDGITWTQGELPASQRWYSICYGDGKFVAIGDLEISASSEDGVNWEQATLPSVGSQWMSICYADGKFVIVANRSSTPVYNAYSYDAIHWINTLVSEKSSVTFYAVGYGNGKFVTIDYNNRAAFYMNSKKMFRLR